MATFRLTPMASDIIIDASATAAWIFDDENSPYADAVFDRVKVNGALVPQFWHIEMRTFCCPASVETALPHGRQIST